MEFSFTSKNGYCPECNAFGRKWYIKDRHIYGDTYEYCLMSMPLIPQPVYKFQDLHDVAAWLSGISDLARKEDLWLQYFISRWIKDDCGDVALVEKDGVQYRYEKENHLLKALPERRQESCWYDKYRECLADAKAHMRHLQTDGFDFPQAESTQLVL